MKASEQGGVFVLGYIIVQYNNHSNTSYDKNLFPLRRKCCVRDCFLLPVYVQQNSPVMHMYCSVFSCNTCDSISPSQSH